MNAQAETENTANFKIEELGEQPNITTASAELEETPMTEVISENLADLADPVQLAELDLNLNEDNLVRCFDEQTEQQTYQQTNDEETFNINEEDEDEANKTPKICEISEIDDVSEQETSELDEAEESEINEIMPNDFTYESNQISELNSILDSPPNADNNIAAYNAISSEDSFHNAYDHNTFLTMPIRVQIIPKRAMFRSSSIDVEDFLSQENLENMFGEVAYALQTERRDISIRRRIERFGELLNSNLADFMYFLLCATIVFSLFLVLHVIFNIITESNPNTFWKWLMRRLTALFDVEFEI